MATHSSVLAWRIPWTEELDQLPSMVSQSRTGLKLTQHACTHISIFKNSLILFFTVFSLCSLMLIQINIGLGVQVLYQCSRVVITKYHKLHRLNLQKRTLSHLWRLEVYNLGRCWQDCFLLEVLREHLFPASLVASGDCQRSLAFLGYRHITSFSGSIFT